MDELSTTTTPAQSSAQEAQRRGEVAETLAPGASVARGLATTVSTLTRYSADASCIKMASIEEHMPPAR
jgi:hypothetical protein